MHKIEEPNTSFFSLTPERVLDAVETLGFRCTGRCLALNSFENRVYEVELDNGPAQFIVAKFYRPGRWSREQIQEEHQFLFELADEDIPVVPPIKNADGESVIPLPGLNLFGGVFPKMSGRLELESSDEELQWLGRLIARVHQVGARRPFVHRPKVSTEWYLDHNREAAEKFIPPDSINAYRATLETLKSFSPLLTSQPFIRVHGDCHRGNLLWRPSEGPLLVDFDDALMGPSVQDLWLIIPSRDEEGRRQLEQVISGYSLIRNFDRSSLAGIEVLRAYRMAQYAGWVAKRWDDPSFPRAFPQYGTENHWRQHLVDLREQISLIQE